MHASRNAEYQTFVPAFVSLLREAMQLRGRGLEDGDYMVREVLQSVIESLRLRCADPVAKLTEALDAYAMDPGIYIPDLLFPLPTHKAELSRRREGARRV